MQQCSNSPPIMVEFSWSVTQCNLSLQKVIVHASGQRDPMRLVMAALAVRDGDTGACFSARLSSARADPLGYIRPPTESTNPNRATRRENTVPIK